MFSKTTKAPLIRRGFVYFGVMEGCFIFSFARITKFLEKPGDDLLSHALRHSTIGAERLNDRVRDGIGWGPLAITTRLLQKFGSSKEITVWNVAL